MSCDWKVQINRRGFCTIDAVFYILESVLRCNPLFSSHYLNSDKRHPLVPMPSLSVIRSGCKHVEYLGNRASWCPASWADCSSEDDDKPADDEEMLRQVEETRDGGSSDYGDFSKAFGFSRERCDVEDAHAFRCANCGNTVSDHDDVISKTFFGRTGKAFLMNNVYVTFSGMRMIARGVLT